MTQRRQHILEQLDAAGERTEAFFAALTPDQLQYPVYSDGARWSVRQVLAHLATIEKSMHSLFRNILADGPGDSGQFDIERFNRSQPAKLDGLPIAQVIARFRDVRAETVAIVAGMSEQDLERTGSHPFHGHGRLERFVRWAYEHAELHEADVRRVLGMKQEPPAA